MPDANPQQLIASGQLSEAAALLEQQGEHARAADLYETLWDHAGVMRCARAAGDLPRALDAAFLARDLPGAEAMLAALQGGARPDLERAARVCQDRGAWAPAATLLFELGETRAAGELYQRAGLRREAADCFEKAGQTRLAIELYRELLESAGDELSPGPLAGDPRYRLGRLLLRSGRVEEALPFVQRAWREDGYGPTPAGRATVAALARSGFAYGARHALELMGGRDGPTLEECLADGELAPEGGDPGEPALAGRYRLGKLLGSGGMGRVYAATDLVAEREVAVKVFTAPSGSRGRDAYRRFLKEARTAGQLQHPHIVALLDANEEMGFMVFELMAGGTLGDRLRPALDLATSRSVLLQIIEGLAAAHQRGIVHRDIKPSNIFFTETGAAKLGDFGVAHLQDSGQTQTGAFVGTVAFMAPEQICGEPVTFATDIYALGVTLFLMLTGQPPFSPPDLVGKHLHAEPPRPSSMVPELPAAVDELVLRCLAKKPSERFDSLETVRLALEGIPVEVDLRPGAASQADPAPRSRRAADSRYAHESTVHDDGLVQALAARDQELGRPVLLVRLAPGAQREAALRLLAAAAAGGDEHLQRVFRLEPEAGQAVLESALGEPAAVDALEGGERLLLLEQLGRALAPLHAAGLAHGAIAAPAINRCGSTYVLSLVPALVRRAACVPADDVRAAASLAAATPPADVGDGASMARWAAEERSRHESAARAARQRELLAAALASAPPEVER
jgi:tRNA A-37 threonylcarbamoyl transferase component Bud32/tetratricopeptide (TPR) repeat protein